MSLLHVRRWITSTALMLGLLPLAAGRLSAQGGTITGKVTDQATGAPLENAQVQASGGGTSLGAVTAADGSYRVLNVGSGVYTIVVRVLGYESQTVEGKRAGDVVNFALRSRPVQLTQTVVTASRSRPEKALDAPAQISVINTDRVEERTAMTVTDHLRSTPGVNIISGGLAQNNVVARGFNNAFSGSLLMLQDYRFAGVPSLRVNVPFLMTGTNEDVERIEVLLGPASALYGPNSSNGVLHVITKSPFDPTAQGTTVTLDGGERSMTRLGLRHATALGDRVAFKLSGEALRARDWEFRDLQEPATFPTTSNVPESRRGQPNQRDFDIERYSGEARLDIRPREGMEAITTFGYSKVGSALELTGFGTAQIRNWTYMNVQQRFRWNRLFLQAFLNSSNAGNDNAQDTKGTVYLRSGESIVDQSRVGALQAQHGFDLGSKQTFTYGVDYIKTNPRTGNTINGANEDVDDMTEYGAYLQSSTRPIKQFELLLAARGDANNVIKGQFFSPRAALIFKPAENQNIRLTYNRAFSTPANFSFFLDLLSLPNAGGSGFDVRGRGNPPKEGFTFRRDCSNTQTGGLCMKSPLIGSTNYASASAASTFRGFMTARSAALLPTLQGAIQQGIASGLQSVGQSAAQANATAAALAPGVAQRLAAHYAAQSPTDAQVASRLAILTSSGVTVNPADLRDIDPLSASYNNTYEIGWKGIVGNRLRYDVSFWGQQRGDVGAPATIVTPNVYFDTTSLKTYLTGTTTGFLAQDLAATLGNAQLGAGIAAGVGAGLGAGLGRSLGAAPLGVVTFNDANTSPNAVYATYLSSNKEIWVKGLDLATDIVATDRVTFEIAYSWQDRGVFQGVYPVGQAPFASNSPLSRGSIGMRYKNEDNGVSYEVRSRYNEGYPVFSGAYATNVSYPIAAGNPGATQGASGGFNRCSPAPAGTFCYENVSEAFLFDAQVAKRFTMGKQKLLLSVNAQNMFNNRIVSFAGVPQIGRMLSTRIQYTF